MMQPEQAETETQESQGFQIQMPKVVLGATIAASLAAAPKMIDAYLGYCDLVQRFAELGESLDDGDPKNWLGERLPSPKLEQM